MRVLIAAASRHGATAEIAHRMGSTLREALAAHGVPAVVAVRDAAQMTSAAGYDAVLLGSAVYMGRWLRPARRLAESDAAALAAVPVWLFSSGPIGTPPRPGADPTDLPAVMRATGARGHRRFAGKLDRRRLGPLERATVRAVRAPEGDFRDWTAIDAWIAGVADALAGHPQEAESMNIVYDALAEQPFFEGFSERELQRLSQCARRSMFHAGARIFEEGGHADRFWVIQRGAVRLDVHVPGRGALPVETLGPHAVLGWSWLFAPYRWGFGAHAVETTHTVEFSGARVREMCDTHPEFGYALTRRFIRVVADRLRHTRRRLVDLSEVAP